MNEKLFRCGIGQDSHRFLKEGSKKPCLLGGVIFPSTPGFEADSDGDVILHAICNAITSITHVPILGKIAPKLCHDQGIRDSKVYLQEALKTLKNNKIVHLAISLEGKRPIFQPKIEEIRKSLSTLLSITCDQIGITATSGDGLTAFAQGEGVQCFCILTVCNSI